MTANRADTGHGPIKCLWERDEIHRQPVTQMIGITEYFLPSPKKIRNKKAEASRGSEIDPSAGPPGPCGEGFPVGFGGSGTAARAPEADGRHAASFPGLLRVGMRGQNPHDGQKSTLVTAHLGRAATVFRLDLGGRGRQQGPQKQMAGMQPASQDS